ncbi:hypothetical protein B5P40_32220, partial [Bacillus sp. SRB_8]
KQARQPDRQAMLVVHQGHELLVFGIASPPLRARRHVDFLPSHWITSLETVYYKLCNVVGLLHELDWSAQLHGLVAIR